MVRGGLRLFSSKLKLASSIIIWHMEDADRVWCFHTNLWREAIKISQQFLPPTSEMIIIANWMSPLQRKVPPLRQLELNVGVADCRSGGTDLSEWRVVSRKVKVPPLRQLELNVGVAVCRNGRLLPQPASKRNSLLVLSPHQYDIPYSLRSQQHLSDVIFVCE